MRERLAGILNRSGALGAAMRLRRFAPLPTLSIFTYHHIADADPTYRYDPAVADATPVQFRRQLELLAKYATVVGIDEVVAALEGGEPLPKNAAMVTFDDGYRSCHDTALPILQSVGLRAVFFIATGFVNERELYWWEKIALVISGAPKQKGTIEYPVHMELDRSDPKMAKQLNAVVKDTAGLDVDKFCAGLLAAFGIAWTRDDERKLADGLIMTWDHVRALAKAGMDVESHGRRHRVLQTLDQATLTDELSGSRTELAGAIGREVRAIAYPVGRRIDKIPQIREAVAAAGYRVGMSNMSGVNIWWPGRPTGGIDPLNVKRLATDRDMSDAMYFAQMAVPPLAYVSPHNK